ncbi:MAG: AI-2E family transporter [Nitrosomonas sp.]
MVFRGALTPYYGGGFAALLRYIPYLGAWLSALLPIALSLLISPEWTIALKVIGLFLLLELITNMVVKPVLYGRGIGVSQAALLVAVAFWAWLWGPIGLILASPLTVCLAVLGRYVPFLGFLDILLGDKPTLSVDHRYYQRLLADDEDEASEIVEEYIKEHSLAHALDKIVIPAMSFARADLRASKLEEVDHNRIILLTKQTLKDQHDELIADKAQIKENSENSDKAQSNIKNDLSKSIVLAIPAKNDIPDEQLMVDMLENIIDSDRIDLVSLPAGVKVSDILKNIEEKSPKLLVILSIPPGSMTHI